MSRSTLRYKAKPKDDREAEAQLDALTTKHPSIGLRELLLPPAQPWSARQPQAPAPHLPRYEPAPPPQAKTQVARTREAAAGSTHRTQPVLEPGFYE